MQFDDLSTLPDEELCALEGRRSLEPADWRRIDEELRRRRQSRVPGLADLPGGPPPATTLTLGDLERVADALTARLARTERQVRHLRWWLVFAPLLWAAIGIAGVLALSSAGLTRSLF